jgi:hypothetical protein
VVVLKATGGVGTKMMKVQSVPGAAHLKFLRHKRRIPNRNFKWKGGSWIMNLPVPITFRSS